MSNLSRNSFIESKEQLIDYIASGSKPKEEWSIGTEHEKFVYCVDSQKPVPYEGERGIKAILEALKKEFDWEPIMEDQYIIGLQKNGQSVSLEPGGQLELSGAMVKTLHQTCAESTSHLRQAQAVSEKLGIKYLGMGFNPNTKRDDVPVMPKGRYNIMREYMPKMGSLGLDMMLRTSTIQVNLDYSSEIDMVKKFRVSLALQPLATAIFAASPFTEGKPNGFQSYRSHIWTDTDPDRCGILPFVFEEGMGFEAYLDHVLNVPMYFVCREGIYHDVSGKSFKDFMKGTLEGFEGQVPTIADWEDHMSTLFPEVRLKKFLEMRGADGGTWSKICALPALWVGLLYDNQSLDEAWHMVKDWKHEDHQYLRTHVPRDALSVPFKNGTVQDFAKKMLNISAKGLERRAFLNNTGEDERIFLKSLYETVESGKTTAQLMLDRYHSDWNGNIGKVFEDCSF